MSHRINFSFSGNARSYKITKALDAFTMKVFDIPSWMTTEQVVENFKHGRWALVLTDVFKNSEYVFESTDFEIDRG